MKLELLEHISATLPAGMIEPAEPSHRQELRNRLQGAATHVAHPKTREDVQAIMRSCYERDIAVIPFGGWTGLVGGQLSEDPDALLVSLRKLNSIRGVFPQEETMTVEAGVVLAQVHAKAGEFDLQFPLTLGAHGSAQIGGLLSTNAGGTSVLRHGTMRDLVLGIEAVLPNGELMQTDHRLRKSNMGFDLRHLLVGAEGTLGIITAATLKLAPQPKHSVAALLVVDNPAKALDVLSHTRKVLGDDVTSCELIDGQGLRWLREYYPDIRQPFDDIPAWSMLLDIGSMYEEAAKRLEVAFEAAFDTGLITDGVISASQTQRAHFWHLREMIPEASRKVGPIASHDVSVPLSQVGRLIEVGRAELLSIAPDIQFNTFGHVGDGNVHFNIFPASCRAREDYAAVKDALTERLHELTTDLGGAISAEHGIGRFKAREFKRLHDQAAYSAMLRIKRALDPKRLMNPGVIFDRI